jgi:hypothetical protein
MYIENSISGLLVSSLAVYTSCSSGRESTRELFRHHPTLGFLNYRILFNYNMHANGGLKTFTKIPTSKQHTT